MVGSLGPVVHGAARTFRQVAVAHALGLLTGAFLMGSALGLLGTALRGAGLEEGLVILAGFALALAVLQVIGMPAVQSRWQVPERWRRFVEPDVLAAFYGLLLGMGVLTAVVVSAFWVMVAVTLMVPVGVAVSGWIIYGLVRGIGFWLLAVRVDRELYFPSRARLRLLTVLTAAAGAVALVSQEATLTLMGGAR